jgi:DNA-binding NarL/FixJ family response regulator
MPAENMIRVVLTDDNLIVREGVRALLLAAGDIDVVDVAGDYEELVARTDTHTPQVVVTDIRMPPSFTDVEEQLLRMVVGAYRVGVPA